MSDHTPGPWGPSMLEERPPREVRARIPGWLALAGYSTPETEANARLIAATPDLLEALEEIAALRERAVFDYLGPSKTMPGSPYDRGYAKALEEVRVLARAAIAKARGDDHA